MKTNEPKTILNIKPTPRVKVYAADGEIGIYHYAIDDTVTPNITRQRMVLDIESARQVAYAIVEYLHDYTEPTDYDNEPLVNKHHTT